MVSMVKVQEWIVNKNLDSNEIYAVKSINFEGTIEKETEKAVYVKFNTNFGNITMWCPKSCVEKIEEIKKENGKAEIIEINNMMVKLSNGKTFLRNSKLFNENSKIGDIVEF